MKFTNKVYNGMKFVALVFLPALGTLYFGLVGFWHFPDPEKVVGSITVLDTFLGVVLHISSKSYNSSDEKYDGTFSVEQSPDGSQTLKLGSLDFDALNTKTDLLFKIQSPSITKVLPPPSTG